MTTMQRHLLLIIGVLVALLGFSTTFLADWPLGWGLPLLGGALIGWASRS